MHLVDVTNIKEAFFEESGSTVGDHAVPLHFTESEATIATSSFSRLPGKDLSWTSATRVDFVLDHMLQSLVVSRPQENHNLHLLSCEAVIHDFISSELISQGVELGRDLVHSVTSSSIVIRPFLEGSCIPFDSSKRCHLGSEALDQVPDGHT